MLVGKMKQTKPTKNQEETVESRIKKIISDIYYEAGGSGYEARHKPSDEFVSQLKELIKETCEEVMPPDHKTFTGWSYDGCGGCGECGQSIGWDLCLKEMRQRLEEKLK